MKVYIVGQGAVGTFFGERLRSIDVEVVYAPRDLDAVVPYAADVAIVATKAYDTAGAIATLQRAIVAAESCVFMTPQNGVGNEEQLAHAFGAERVVAAALTVPVGRARDGRAVAVQAGGLALAPLGNNAFNWLVATFAGAGLDVRVVESWRSLKWSKLLLNVIANASCAILNVLPNRLVDYDDIFALEIRAVREVHAVMRRLGIAAIDLPRYRVRALQVVAALPISLACPILARRIAGARGTKAPSLLLDLRGGKSRTEVEVLNGAVAAHGHRCGVATPVNTVYARVLGDIAHMPQLWAKYRERPEVLAAEVAAEVRRTKTV